VLIEAGPRILPGFEPSLASKATRELEQLGVQIWTHSRVTKISPAGVCVGEEQLSATNVLWAAGVQASPLGRDLQTAVDRQGRVVVGEDLSVAGHPEVFVVGDQAHFRPEGRATPLPGVATVALQQGQCVARTIIGELKGQPRAAFEYNDKGQMAAIGHRRAVMQRGRFRSAGVFAWLMWLLVHIYFLSGFKNRVFVLIQWGWSYLTFARGSRLIVERDWRSYAPGKSQRTLASTSRSSSVPPATTLGTVGLRPGIPRSVSTSISPPRRLPKAPPGVAEFEPSPLPAERAASVTDDPSGFVPST
jgi:NADH dehydrogenase